MMNLAATLAVLLIVWVVHIVWFRVRPPRNRVQALLALFAAGLVAYLGGFGWSAWQAAEAQPVHEITFGATAVVLYVLLALAYVIVYTAVEVDSPSAMIMLLARQRGGEGITYAELRAMLTDDYLVLARLEDLVAAGSVRFTGTDYQLEPRGLIIARLFGAYRALLGRDLGG